MVAGKSKKNLIPAFDGTKATSTVRFMLDSVLRGESSWEKCGSGGKQRGVVDYVSKTTNAIGFVWLLLIGNVDDTSQTNYEKR